MTVFAVFGVRCQRPVRRWAVAAIIAWHKATTAWVLYFSNPSLLYDTSINLPCACYLPEAGNSQSSRGRAGSNSQFPHFQYLTRSGHLECVDNLQVLSPQSADNS